MSIISLLNQIRNNEVVLPAIQRDFVWERPKIQKLLDSIFRGYPVGIALLWETYHELQYRQFVQNYQTDTLATFKDNPNGRRIRVVLDGQQRLQSLFIALFGSFDAEELWFDVLSGRSQDDVSESKFLFDFCTQSEALDWNKTTKDFFASPASERDNAFLPWYYVKVSDLYAMSAQSREKLISKTIKDLGLEEEDQTRVRVNLATFEQMLTKDENVLKLSVIDENLPPESPDRKTETDVLEIFVRINREGTALNRADLIFSMLKLNWKESADALPEFVQKVNKGNSLGLNADFVIRCLFAVSDLGAKFDLDLLRKRANVQKLRDNFEKCCNAIRATVDFVTEHCWIHNSELLGGRAALVPFVYYFFHQEKHRIPNAEIPRARRALYFFGFSRAFSRYGDSRAGAFIRDELKPLASASVFPVEQAIGWVAHWEGLSFGDGLIQRNPQLTLHLIQNRTGARVQFDANLPEIDHIFPRSTLRSKGLDESEINHFANFWILAREKNRNKSDSPPSKYFADVPDVEMKRALIDRDLLDYRRYNTFIKARAEKILQEVAKKLDINMEMTK
jgi:hypothetical protein